MKITFRLIILSLSILLCSGQGWTSDNSPLGSRSSGIGNASVSLSDLWSAQNNQAGLGFVRKINAGACYHNQFLLKETATKAFAAALPVKGGTVGVCVSSFGYSLFNRNKYGIAFGKSFGDKFSAGFMMDCLQTTLAEYGKKELLVAEAGIQAKPVKNLTIGVHLFNLTRAKLAAYNDERIPVILRLGADYKFSDKVFVALEAEKDMDKKPMAKAGLEYRPVKELYLRTGISTNPSLSCFGIGVNFRQLQLDLSSTYHSIFGFSPQLGLTYEFDPVRKQN